MSRPRTLHLTAYLESHQPIDEGFRVQGFGVQSLMLPQNKADPVQKCTG